MPRKRKLDKEEISVEHIYDHFVSDNLIENLSSELYLAFQEKGSYKYLKSIGMHQISNAAEWSGTPYEEVQKKARMHYDKIKEVTSTIEEEIEQIIKEKFQGAFRNTVKEEILKFINKSSSTGSQDVGKSANITIKPLTIENIIKKEKENKSTILKKFGTLKEYDTFLDNASVDSLSSVHTTDLSSFDDAISISSDDDTGRERTKVSIQFAQEELDRYKTNRVVETCDVKVKKEKKSPKSAVVIKSELPPSDSASEYEKSSPRRIRKPNSKYFSNDVMSPFEIKIEDSSTLAPAKSTGSAIRKRGRPRLSREMSPSEVDTKASPTPTASTMDTGSGIRKRGRPRKYHPEP